VANGETVITPGALLGRYRIVGLIGSGGMGDVFRAHDSVLGRTVALKVLPKETIATPDRRRRFEAEARSAATLSHPNLVAVHDFGESGGILYIVQELVAGRTVAQIVAAGPVPPERAAEWAAQAADGLAHAHESGVIHRDVKPANLIVGDDGRLRVVDFGLAKMVGGAGTLGLETLTKDGFIVGSIPYMSPEQALGKDIDGRSDGFSLGIVLYEMLTARKPFEGPSAVDTMHAIAHEAPRAFAPGDPGVPPPLAAVVEKALEKSPDERYQSLREMAVDLRRFARRASASVPMLTPATGVERVPLPPRRSPRRIAMRHSPPLRLPSQRPALGMLPSRRLTTSAATWLAATRSSKSARRAPAAATAAVTREAPAASAREVRPVECPAAAASLPTSIRSSN